MASSVKIRIEEYTTLGDFIKASFERDQAKILERFPKRNAVFLNGFATILSEVKDLESDLVLSENQKRNTIALYAEAYGLNKELNFLSSYISEAGLNSKVVTSLKEDLASQNIEGAILKIEAVKQYVIAHLDTLVEEGMAANFATTLAGHGTTLAAKNEAQNAAMNSRKKLTENNKDKYDSLYDYIATIAKNGKLVFKDTVTEDEYNMTKIIKRMRAFGQDGQENPVVN